MNEKKEEIIHIGWKLNKRTDADILEAIGGPDMRQGELKRLLRIGLEKDNKGE